jgi:hypothetical protein
MQAGASARSTGKAIVHGARTPVCGDDNRVLCLPGRERMYRVWSLPGGICIPGVSLKDHHPELFRRIYLTLAGDASYCW